MKILVMMKKKLKSEDSFWSSQIFDKTIQFLTKIKLKLVTYIFIRGQISCLL
jgi:hypothetical protein